jgi:hypothetical protein
LFLASIRTKHKITRTTDSAARSHENNEQPSQGGQVHDQLSQEQFDDEIDKNVALILTQEEYDEEQGGEEGREEEADEGEEEEDDDDDLEEGYESPEDPFPRELRRRPMEDELDRDFDPQDDVGTKP